MFDYHKIQKNATLEKLVGNMDGKSILMEVTS